MANYTFTINNFEDAGRKGRYLCVTSESETIAIARFVGRGEPTEAMRLFTETLNQKIKQAHAAGALGI